MLLQEEYIFRLKGKKRRISWEDGSTIFTNEIKDRMQLLGNSGDYDVIITEIGR
jgi:hypothetical protein